MSQSSTRVSRPAAEPVGIPLEVRNVRKAYGNTHALRGVTFSLRPGTIHALLGGNGSGKSTLIKILAGVEVGAGEGEIVIGGNAHRDDKTTPAWARDNGIVFVHQDLGLFEHLSVAENLVAGAAFPHQAGLVRWGQIRKHAREVLGEFSLDISPDSQVSSLRPAQKTLLAVARALGSRDGTPARVLVLDEPTASLPAAEAKGLLASLTRFRDDGYTILYVSHRLDEVLEIADWVTVLRDGEVAADRAVASVTKPILIEVIAGRRLNTVFPAKVNAGHGDPVLEVNHLSGGPLNDVSFSVARGEVVGIAGLIGSGRTSLLQTVFGMHPRRGVIRRPGGELRPGVRQAIKSGLAYVPEDRNEDAAFADLSIANNTAASHDGDYFRSGRHDGRAERSYAREVIARLGVKAQGADVPVGTLSGGNQQKVMIGRWLRPGTKVLLLDEPTQGVDVGARADIYREIGRLREEGLGIVLVSSDDEELLGLADTVVVLRRGSVACIRPRVAIDAKALSHFVHGLNPEEEDGS